MRIIGNDGFCIASDCAFDDFIIIRIIMDDLDWTYSGNEGKEPKDCCHSVGDLSRTIFKIACQNLLIFSEDFDRRIDCRSLADKSEEKFLRDTTVPKCGGEQDVCIKHDAKGHFARKSSSVIPLSCSRFLDSSARRLKLLISSSLEGAAIFLRITVSSLPMTANTVPSWA